MSPGSFTSPARAFSLATSPVPSSPLAAAVAAVLAATDTASPLAATAAASPLAAQVV